MSISLSPVARNLIRSTFFGKDFDSYRQEILDTINARFGSEVASNIVASEQGVMLIEVVAFALSTLSWYGDRQADDTTLRDARVRTAVVTIARQLGYKASAAVPPVVDLRVQLTAAAPVQLVIKKGQKCRGPNNLTFETIADVVFDAGQVGSGSPVGMHVTGIVVDPSTPTNIFAGTTTGVLKTTNSGVLWSAANSGLTNLNIRTIVMDPTNSQVLYVGTSTGGVFKTTNGGASWTASNSGLTNLKILSLAVHPSTTSTLYVGTDGGGVFKSINSGATWFPANGSLTETVIQTLVIDPVTPNTIYAGGFSGGVFKSINGALSWAPSSTGLTTLDIKALAIDPVTPATIYAATNGSSVFKSIDSGATWLAANNGLTSNNPVAIAVDPTTPTTVYVATTESGVFKSINGGATWASTSSGLTTTTLSSIAVDSTNSAVLYTGTRDGGVFGSTNSAATWNSLNTGIDDPIKTVPAREGRTLEEVFRSNGLPNQFFQLSTIPTGMSIAQGTVVVTVGGIVWPEVRLLTYEQTNQVEIEYGLTPPRVIFGDGIAGNIPPKDAEVRVNYFVTSGTGGAVASNTVTSFVGPILAGTTPVGTVLSHDAASTPGSDPEPLEKIKVTAPQVFQAAQRAVTRTDLDGWINSFVDPSFGAVAKGHATTPRSFAEDAEALTIVALLKAFGVPTTITSRIESYFDKILSSNCEANVVSSQILATDSVGRYVPAPAGLAQALETFLEGIAVATTKPVVTDGSINLLSVSLSVEVGLEAGFTSEIAKTTVRDAVRDALQNLLLGRDYGVSLRIGDLYETAEAIEGVRYSHITMVVRTATGDDVTATRVNEFGDLEIADHEVITMGATPNVVIL